LIGANFNMTVISLNIDPAIPTIKELSMKERRIYERHIVILPTKLEAILTPGEKKVFDVETRNISIGGAFIYSKDRSFFQEGRRVISA